MAYTTVKGDTKLTYKVAAAFEVVFKSFYVDVDAFHRGCSDDDPAMLWFVVDGTIIDTLEGAQDALRAVASMALAPLT